jgi:hypothetical protein
MRSRERFGAFQQSLGVPYPVLLGTDVDGSALRWSFNDIKSDSLYWKGEISSDGGKTWRVEQEMHLTRHMP